MVYSGSAGQGLIQNFYVFISQYKVHAIVDQHLQFSSVHFFFFFFFLRLMNKIRQQPYFSLQLRNVAFLFDIGDSIGRQKIPRLDYRDWTGECLYRFYFYIGT